MLILRTVHRKVLCIAMKILLTCNLQQSLVSMSSLHLSATSCCPDTCSTSMHQHMALSVSTEKMPACRGQEEMNSSKQYITKNSLRRAIYEPRLTGGSFERTHFLYDDIHQILLECWCLCPFTHKILTVNIGSDITTLDPVHIPVYSNSVKVRLCRLFIIFTQFLYNPFACPLWCSLNSLSKERLVGRIVLLCGAIQSLQCNQKGWWCLGQDSQRRILQCQQFLARLVFLCLSLRLSHLLPLSLGYIWYFPEENYIAQRLLFHSSGELMEFLVLR